MAENDILLSIRTDCFDTQGLLRIVLSCTVLAAGTGALFAREAYLAPYLALCRTVTVTAENLCVRRSLRGHVVPIERLRLDDADVIAIGDDSRLFPTVRPNGIHVGDDWAGGFRLRNGGKSFLVLTTRDRVPHISGPPHSDA